MEVKEYSENKKAAVLNHVIRHPTMHSKTLMRGSVTKPAPSLKRQLKVTPALYRDKSTTTLISPKVVVFKSTHHNMDIKKSDYISRYADFTQDDKAQANEPTVIEPKHIVEVEQGQSEEVHPKNSLDMLLEKAIDEATSHLEPVPKVRKRRMSWLLS